MSIAIMNRVWRYSKAEQGQLLVLLAIADFADDVGRAFPSVPTLATKSRLSDRQAQRVLKLLVNSGELKILKNRGPTDAIFTRLRSLKPRVTKCHR